MKKLLMNLNKRPKLREKFKCISNDIEFNKKKRIHLSEIRDDERQFMERWCQHRDIEDVAMVLAITYWIRSRSQVSICFMLCESNKTIYMILCIHLALKWLGDEYNRCRFMGDLKQVYPSIDSEKHQGMEMDLLWALNWEMQ